MIYAQTLSVVVFSLLVGGAYLNSYYLNSDVISFVLAVFLLSAILATAYFECSRWTELFRIIQAAEALEQNLQRYSCPINGHVPPA